MNPILLRRIQSAYERVRIVLLIVFLLCLWGALWQMNA